MKFKNLLKFSLGVIFALPATLFFGSELFANNFSKNFQLEVSQEKLLACGGGGGGGASPAAKKAKKAAAGEPTNELEAEIKELESLISE